MILLPLFCHSQNEVSLTGIILDKDNLQPMTQAVMHTVNGIYCADSSGRISASVAHGDVVAFAHVGYQTVRMHITDSVAHHPAFTVLMSADTIMLSEVVARPRTVKLEQVVATMPLYENISTDIARYNFQLASFVALSRPSLSVDADAATKRTLAGFSSSAEYKGMIQPNQVFGISTSRTLAPLFDKNSKLKPAFVPIGHQMSPSYP